MRTPSRPAVEGRLALPKHEFGLDVSALVGHPRSAHHRSIPDIHHAVVERGVAVAQRPVTTLLERDDALRSLTRQDADRLRRIPQPQGRVILALDGVSPDVGLEGLWGLRDCRSGEVLFAHSVFSAALQRRGTRP